MIDLTKNEELILLLIWKLGKEAYGVPLRMKFKDITGKTLNYGALYNLLYQLERKQFVESEESMPTPVKGGRRKVVYSITHDGLTALKNAQLIQQKAWAGISDYAFDREING